MIETGENALVLVEYRTSLTVHHLPGAHYIAAKGLADGLVTQADAEDRQFAGKVLDGFDGNAGFGRRARTRGNHDALRLEGFDFGDGQFVVAHDFDLGTQL